MGLYGRSLICAHRCLYPGYPENTVLSLRKAIENGCDYVEIDCLYTKDKVMVVSHDDTVDRCTNGTGLIRDLTYDYIQSLDAGEGGKIPTVEEIFFEISKTNICAELHIKDMEVLEFEKYPENNIYDLIIKYKLEKRVNINIDTIEPVKIINSNNYYKEKKFRFSYSAYSFDESILKLIKKFDFFGIDVGKENLTKENVDLIHKYNLEIQSYPVNDKEWMEKLVRADVDVIQTDNMDLLINVLEEES